MLGLIVFGVGATILLILVLITDHRMERDKEFYKCYCKQEYRGDASNFKCQGFGKACRHCVYRKNFEKEAENAD